MAKDGKSGPGKARDPSAEDVPAESVAGGLLSHPLTTAAIIGGAALAATTGAYFGTRALARRNGGESGKVNSVLATAITACDVGHGAHVEPQAAAEPSGPVEPTIGRH